MVPANVSREQPLSIPCDRGIIVRTYDEMEVIRHQAVSEHRYSATLLSLSHQCDERSVVCAVMEDARLIVASIDEVIVVTCQYGPGRSGHLASVLALPGSQGPTKRRFSSEKGRFFSGTCSC